MAMVWLWLEMGDDCAGMMMNLVAERAAFFFRLSPLYLTYCGRVRPRNLSFLADDLRCEKTADNIVCIAGAGRNRLGRTGFCGD